MSRQKVFSKLISCSFDSDDTFRQSLMGFCLSQKIWKSFLVYPFIEFSMDLALKQFFYEPTDALCTSNLRPVSTGKQPYQQ